MRSSASLPEEKIQKDFRQFAMIGLAAAIISLIAFGWLAIIGVAASARALVLFKRRDKVESVKLKRYRVMAISGLLLSVVDLILLIV